MNGDLPNSASTIIQTNQPPSTEKSPKQDNEPENNRDQWGGQFEFLLACLGNAVGLGNCWRFPYLCYKNGGGAFLVPYVVCCLVIGLPLFLIELGLGQFSSMGPAHLYANLSPLFKGVGMASVISSAIVAIYYNMIIAWTLFYFVESFLGQKWQNCDNPFNSLNCTTIKTGHNFTSNSISSTEEFYNNYVLDKSSGIDELTSVNWKLVLALFVSWVIVALALIKGIQSSGKVVYFTATFPYMILTILFVRGVTLDGAMDGLRYYITPNWTRVRDIEVWRDASVQVFYSFGIGGGGMITYASYNRFHNPVVKHALMVGIGDFLTSIFCGAVVFTMIGYMAAALNKPIESIVQSGTGLAFIVIPEGLSQMPISLAWSMLFFSMLFLLGIDSQFAMVETVITYIFDSMRNRKYQINKPMVVSAAALFWFVCGLPLCTNAGVFILNLMDTFSAGIPCLIIGILEIFIITYIYGLDKFFDNLHQMTGWNPRILLKSNLVVMITVVAPAVISVILYKEVFVLFRHESSLKYGDYIYPEWANWIGWSLALISISAIPLGMIHQTGSTLFAFGSDKSWKHRLRLLFVPTEMWWQNADNNGQHMADCCPLKTPLPNAVPAPNYLPEPEHNSSLQANGHTNLSFLVTEF